MPKGSSHSGHRQRMFQRFMESGFDGYQPHEVIEQLLFEVLPRRNTNEIAHALIDRFGTIAGVLSARREDLMQVPGIGGVSADFLTGILPEMGRTMISELRGHAPKRPALLVIADYFLRVSSYDSGAVLLGADGKIAGFLGVDPYGEEKLTGEIPPSEESCGTDAEPCGTDEEPRRTGENPLPSAIVLEHEKNRGKGAVRPVLAEKGIVPTESFVFTKRLSLI
ncbi:MAG: hypothetical protein IKQ92_09115 [Clostridia bacterium]|nr:hypothetical protein [Clostridia bacterium]